MKKYLIQTKYPDSTTDAAMHTAGQIIDMYGFRDCSDCDFRVFDVSDFGVVTELIHQPATKAPYNYHRFVSFKTGVVVFDGYSKEH